jgi:hypothetical protein
MLKERRNGNLSHPMVALLKKPSFETAEWLNPEFQFNEPETRQDRFINTATTLTDMFSLLFLANTERT